MIFTCAAILQCFGAAPICAWLQLILGDYGFNSPSNMVAVSFTNTGHTFLTNSSSWTFFNHSSVLMSAPSNYLHSVVP